MPSSLVLAFKDPEPYVEAVREGALKYTYLERGTFDAKLARIDLHAVRLDRFTEKLARVIHSDGLDGRVYFVVQIRPGPRVTRDGVALGVDRVLQARYATPFLQRADGPSTFGNLSLPYEEAIPLFSTTAGCDWIRSNELRLIRTPIQAITKLQRLHAAAEDLAEHAPAVIAHPEAARGLEQALIEAVTHCLAGEAEGDRAAQRQHAAIMRRFHNAVESHVGEALYIPEVCKEIGVSIRTLHTCCLEHIGISPKRYLLLRRMNSVHSALPQSNRGDTTVTEIATRYGFWQFGRLSVEYKALFGESPSSTLGRS